MDELVSELKQSGILKTPKIIEAFLKIDRKDFIHHKDIEYAYIDIPLSIGLNQTISQPTTVAFMLELLDPKPNQKILDLGSGSGWTTALLSYIVGEKGEVFGLEIIPELVLFGRGNIDKYDFPQAKIQLAQKKVIGLEKEAPFDRILVSAAASDMPLQLIDQLKENGRMVVPVNNSIWRIDKREEKIIKKEYPGFIFVPLIE